MVSFIEKSYFKRIDGTGLAIMRICYGVALLCEIIQLFYFRHLVFDEIPYVQPYEVSWTPLLLVWMGVVVLLIAGLFTRAAALANYLISLAVIATTSSYEYHMFYIYMSINFLLLLLPVSQCLSLDRLLLTLKYTNTRQRYTPPKEVPKIGYLLIVYLGIGFFYIDSVFYKLISPMWLNGLGMWMPASLPMATHTNFTGFILNQEWLVKMLGYLTLLFEAVFVFVCWRKKWRLPLFIIGVGLHVGIVMEFPIPWFGLGVVGIYMALLPVSYWQRLGKWLFPPKKTKLVCYYDAECPLCVRTKVVVAHFDVWQQVAFKTVQGHAPQDEALSGISQEALLLNMHAVTRGGKVHKGIDTYRQVLLAMPHTWLLGLALSIPGIYHLAKWAYTFVAGNRVVERCTEDTCGYTPPVFPENSDEIKLLRTWSLGKLKAKSYVALAFFFLLLQGIVSYNSGIFDVMRRKTGIADSWPDRQMLRVQGAVGHYFKTFFGITHHALFMDSHFRGYNHIIGIAYVHPNGNEEWLPIMNEHGQPSSYLKGFNWAKWTFRTNNPQIDQQQLSDGIRDFTIFWMNQQGIESARFRVKVKKVDIPQAWQKGYLEEQMNHPWVNAGEAVWTNGAFDITIQNIEEI